MPSILKTRRFLCCDLLTTAFVTGWVGLVFSIAAFSIGQGLIDYLCEVVKKIDNNDLIEFKAFLTGFNHLQIFSFLISAFLLTGAVKKNRLFLLPWLISNGIQLFLFTIFAVIGTLVLLCKFGGEAFASVCLLGIIFGPIYALWVYLWLAIHSLYIALREKESNIENIGLLNGSNSGQPIDDNYDRLQDTMLQDV